MLRHSKSEKTFIASAITKIDSMLRHSKSEKFRHYINQEDATSDIQNRVDAASEIESMCAIFCQSEIEWRRGFKIKSRVLECKIPLQQNSITAKSRLYNSITAKYQPLQTKFHYSKKVRNQFHYIFEFQNRN
ncbi:hypothetical protein L1887_15283 [Cichorium endivia]|nr:hypothetical protein L1887_15283 [Cichorium endivia]